MCRKDQSVALTGCVLALAALIPVALFQAEVIEQLPDPPGDIFDSERITMSKTAHPFGIPDSYLGLASYGTTLALVLLARKNPTARKLLGLKLVGDGAVASFNAVRQVVTFGKICSWCTGTALATGLIVYGGREAIVGDAKAATKSL